MGDIKAVGNRNNFLTTEDHRGTRIFFDWIH